MAKRDRKEYMRTYRANKKIEQKELPDYGIDTPTRTESAGDGTLDLASDLPSQQNALALNIAEWEDAVEQMTSRGGLKASGYRTIRQCLPVVETIEKLAKRTAKLNWVVRGEGARAEAVGEIFEQSLCLYDAIVWLTWAKIEGFRVMQIKSAPARQGVEPWIIPDFFMGGRMKEKAGGEIAWDGRRLVQIRSQETHEHREPAELPIDQFIIHRPGGGSSPEGDGLIGVVTFLAAFKWEDAMKSIDAHAELYSVPMRILSTKMDGVRPDRVQGLLDAKAEKLRRLKQNKEFVMADTDMLSLIEPKGHGFNDMVAYAQYLEGLIDQLFLGNTLTSKTNEGGRTGDTSVHADQQDDDVMCNAIQLAESFNRHLIPWIIKKNPNLPPLEEGEFEPYLWPTPPHEDEDLSVEVDDEGEEVTDVEGEEVTDVEGEESEEMSGHETGRFTLLREGIWLPHTVTLDEDGNGTSSETQDHVHQVVSGVVESALGHTHKLEKIDGQETGEEDTVVDEPDEEVGEDDEVTVEDDEPLERGAHPVDDDEDERGGHLDEDEDIRLIDDEIVVEGNPFSIVRREGKFLVIKTETGEVMGTHDTLEEAESQIIALEINVDE